MKNFLLIFCFIFFMGNLYADPFEAFKDLAEDLQKGFDQTNQPDNLKEIKTPKQEESNKNQLQKSEANKEENSEVIVVKSISKNRDFSWTLLVDRADYNQTDRNFTIPGDAKEKVFDLIESSAGKKIRVTYVNIPDCMFCIYDAKILEDKITTANKNSNTRIVYACNNIIAPEELEKVLTPESCKKNCSLSEERVSYEADIKNNHIIEKYWKLGSKVFTKENPQVERYRNCEVADDNNWTCRVETDESISTTENKKGHIIDTFIMDGEFSISCSIIE